MVLEPEMMVVDRAERGELSARGGRVRQERKERRLSGGERERVARGRSRGAWKGGILMSAEGYNMGGI